MTPLLLDKNWKAKGDEKRVQLACKFLELEEAQYGVIFGATMDPHFFENAWMLFLQQADESIVEYIHFGENRFPDTCGPGLPRDDASYDKDWQLTARGNLAKQVTDEFHRRGVCDANEEPVEWQPHLDGGFIYVIAKHPSMEAICSIGTSTGAVYSTGTTGNNIINYCVELACLDRSAYSRWIFTNRIRQTLKFSTTADVRNNRGRAYEP